jgi:uncharacterized protein
MFIKPSFLKLSMIKNSFCFLDGIGQKTEKELWQNGISNWESFLSAKSIEGMSSSRKSYYDRKLMEAIRCLYNLDVSFFKNTIPQSESWRFYDFFREDAVFLDIETDGLGMGSDITVFGLYNGIDTKMMISGINLDIRSLRDELSKYKLIVTFNGASFDVPFINKRYPGLIPNVPNFDVRVVAGRLGFKGGLKAIERQLGIGRKDIVKDFNGGDALTLWRMYRATGDEYYLNLLLEYNEFDIVNLKIVADKMVRMMKERLLRPN